MIINLICRNLWGRMAVGSAPAYSLIGNALIHFNFSREGKDQRSKEVQSKKSFLNKSKLSEEGYFQRLGHESEQIALIIKQYRLADHESGNFLEVFSETCKKLSNHYRQENHECFISYKDELNNIVMKMLKIDLQAMTFLQFLNILDFYRIASRLEVLNQANVDAAKKLLFNIIDRYLVQNPDLSPRESLSFFCKLTALSYPEMQKISLITLRHLEKMIEEEGTLSFPPFQHYILIKAMSKKMFLTYIEKQIFKIVLLDLAKKDTFDKLLMISIFKAIIDLNPKANFAEYEILQVIDLLLEKFVPKLQQNKNIHFMKYLTDCPLNENRHYYQLIKNLYNRILKKMENQASNDLIIFIADIVKHLKPEDIKPEHQQIVIKTIYELQKTEIRLRLEFQIAALINNGFFNSEIEQLHQLIDKPTFQFSWTLPYSYSQAGFKFPVSRLLAKGERGIVFRQNLNFLKAANAIGIQFRLQSENVELKTLYQKLIENIKEAQWNSKSTQWLWHSGLYHPQVLRIFNKYYGHLFREKIKPDKNSLEQDLNLKINGRINQLSFWNYICLVKQVNEKFYSDLVYSLPVNIPSLCSKKQTSRINLEPDLKPFLLATLYIKLLQFPKSQYPQEYEFCIVSLLNLMAHYSQQIIKADESFLEIYFKVALEICRTNSNLKKNIVPQANYIFMNLITLENKKIKNSTWMYQLIKQLNQNSTIFSFHNKHDQIQNAIIRSGLLKNLISEVGIKYAKFNYFSPKEQQYLQAISGKLSEKIENIIPLFNSANISQDFLTKNKSKINELIEIMPFEDLTKCLLHYSFASSVQNDKFLLKIVQLFLEKMTDLNFDFISVLSNIHEQLNSISPQSLQDILKKIVEKIQDHLAEFFIYDHCQLLGYLNKYDCWDEEYGKKLFDYALENKKRGTSLIDVILQISLNELLADPKIDLMEQLSILNLEKYLKILCLYEDSLSVQGLLESAIKKQVFPVFDSHIIRYLQSKYTIKIKKNINENIIFQRPNDLGKKFISSLANHQEGCVKIEEVGDGQIFLLGNSTLLAFVEHQRHQESKNTEKILKSIFPQRKLVIKQPSLTMMEIQQLLRELSQGNGVLMVDLSLGPEEEHSILTQLNES